MKRLRYLLLCIISLLLLSLGARLVLFRWIEIPLNSLGGRSLQELMLQQEPKRGEPL